MLGFAPVSGSPVSALGDQFIPEAETPGGTFGREGDLSRAFRRSAEDAARTFGREGDPARVFRPHLPR